MKGLYFTLILVLMFSLLLMPLLALSGATNRQSLDNSFRVFMTETAEISLVPAREYAICVAANNLEKDAHEETIKAEIVAAYTKALYYKNKNENTNFDIDDTTDGFIPLEKIKSKLGKDFNSLYNKLYECADAVLYKTILYNNAPILAERHNANAGKTEDSKNVLSESFPYLVSVESAGDLLYENLLSEKTIPLNEMKNHLLTQNLTPTDKPKEYFKNAKTTDAKIVLSVEVLGEKFSGEEIKNIFNLPSCCFTVSFKDDAFVFSVKGEGSFLGLSRAGAEYMAKNGATYAQILSWYYPECVLK